MKTIFSSRAETTYKPTSQSTTSTICDNPEDPRYQLFCGGSTNEVTARTPSWKNHGYYGRALTKPSRRKYLKN